MRTTTDRLGGAATLATAGMLGLSAGAMLTEQLVLVSWWRSLPPDAFLRWFGENEPRLVAFFAPLQVSGALFALAAAGLGWSRPAVRGPLAAAAVLAVAALLMYPAYFEGVNARFVAGTIPPGEVAGALRGWSAWQWVRIAIGAGAFAAALGAVRRQGG